MIIIRLMGGLGNQMFQYAFGLSTSKRNNTKLKIDTTLLKPANNQGSNQVIRNFELDAFKIDLQFATNFEIELYNGSAKNRFVLRRLFFLVLRKVLKKKLYIQPNHDFDPNQLKIRNNTCIVGRWQSEIYFRDVESDIREHFKFKKDLSESYEEYLTKILQSENSTSVHIRRTDYVNHPEYSQKIGALTESYYLNAISLLNKQVDYPTLFIFSDDIEYTKTIFANMKISNECIFIDPKVPNPHDELRLMTNCKHHIISNSTFAWWGAWLANKQEGAKTIAPKSWARSSKYKPPYIQCKSWILL